MMCCRLRSVRRLLAQHPLTLINRSHGWQCPDKVLLSGFSLQAAKRQEVAEIVTALEAHNPTQNPTQHLDQVEGAWNLLYTTITITVSRHCHASQAL